jgi:hypothetical protein
MPKFSDQPLVVVFFVVCDQLGSDGRCKLKPVGLMWVAPAWVFC